MELTEYYAEKYKVTPHNAPDCPAPVGRTASVNQKLAVNAVTPGMLVTCKREVEAHGSNYPRGKSPEVFFRPGMVGRVVDVDCPYVRYNPKDAPKRTDTFCLVEFRVGDLCAFNASQHPGNFIWKVALDYYNVVIVEPSAG